MIPRTGKVIPVERSGGTVMPKVVKVTPAQVNAAKLKIKRSAASGRFVASSVTKIANAKRASTARAATPGTAT